MATGIVPPVPHMRGLFLCSGIGGLELAAEATGLIDVVGQCEIDEFCNRVLAYHWPDVKRMGDIAKVVGDEFGRIDILAAGFPCQPVSHAGERRGSADARWLWPDVYRIVQRARPTWVLFENVPGLLTLGLATVLNDLGGKTRNPEIPDIPIYEAWTLVLPAHAVGAPHQRERVFIVGHRIDADDDGDVANARDGERQRPMFVPPGWITVSGPGGVPAIDGRGADDREPLADTGRAGQPTGWDGGGIAPVGTVFHDRIGSGGEVVGDALSVGRHGRARPRRGDDAHGDTPGRFQGTSESKRASDADVADAAGGRVRRGRASRRGGQSAPGGETGGSEPDRRSDDVADATGGREPGKSGGDDAGRPLERAGVGTSGGIERGDSTARIRHGGRIEFDGASVVADTTNTGLPIPGRAGQSTGDPQAGTGLEHRPQRRGGNVANPDDKRRQRRAGVRRQAGRGVEHASGAMEHADSTGREEREFAPVASGSGHATGRHDPGWIVGEVEPRVGVSVDGIPGRLAGHPGWPAGPGEPQHPWEAPRTVPPSDKTPNRAAKLKALGNAVVPKQVFPVFRGIAETWLTYLFLTTFDHSFDHNVGARGEQSTHGRERGS